MTGWVLQCYLHFEFPRGSLLDGSIKTHRHHLDASHQILSSDLKSVMVLVLVAGGGGGWSWRPGGLSGPGLSQRRDIIVSSLHTTVTQ